jgi:hypothetical protein
MSGGYSTPDIGSFRKLFTTLSGMQDQTREIGRPTGTQTAQALKQLRVLVSGLLNATDISVSGNIAAGGDLTAGGAVSAIDPYNFDVTTLPGSRRTVSVHVSGRFGQTVSSIVKKTNLGELPFTAADLLAIAPYVFEYRAQIDIRDNPKNPCFNPEYEVPTELGLMAEHLVDRGLDLFVYLNEDGSPADINYALFGAVASLVVGADHERRLAALERELRDAN